MCEQRRDLSTSEGKKTAYRRNVAAWLVEEEGGNVIIDG